MHDFIPLFASRAIEFNTIPSSDMARLDQDNSFCSASSCTLQFNGGLTVNDLSVTGDMVLKTSGDKVFDFDVANLDSSRYI